MIRLKREASQHERTDVSKFLMESTNATAVLNNFVHHLLRLFHDHDLFSRKKCQSQVWIILHAFDLMRVYPILFSIQSGNFYHILI